MVARGFRASIGDDTISEKKMNKMSILGESSTGSWMLRGAALLAMTASSEAFASLRLPLPRPCLGLQSTTTVGRHGHAWPSSMPAVRSGQGILGGLRCHRKSAPALVDSKDDSNKGLWSFSDSPPPSKLKLLAMMVPSKKSLMFRQFLCVVLLVMGRVANVMVPILYRNVIDNLTLGHSLPLKAAAQIADLKSATLRITVIYIMWKLSQSISDVLRSLTWVPVMQDVKERVNMRLLGHLLSQSVRFHISTKTGEIMNIIDRGATSVERLMDLIPFRLVPAAVDVIIAGIVLTRFNYPAFGAIAAGTVSTYMFVTYVLTKWRTKYWRAMVEAEQVVKGKAVESMLNFETVKLFAAEKHELKQYSGLIDDWKAKQLKTEYSLAVLNFMQQFVVCAGLGISMYFSGMGVLAKRLTVGDFVMVNAYLLQVCTPLTWLGSMYRMVEDAFIDSEKMLALLEVSPEVQDSPDAESIVVGEGVVKFEDVSFSYDGTNDVLKGVSFEVPRGKTLAIVGESGGGKSTIARLLFRLYDVTGGRITIDDVDIRKATQESLRQAIGVVPQETVLFNEDVTYNIRYGSMRDGEPTGGEEEIIESSKASQLHEKVLGFPDGYETRVGEKGLRLSGGEKQRVGIARTIIKSPNIVLLDEATSALDSKTEGQIQKALDAVCQGRTTLVIAHRLSTIVDADEIIVLRKGVIEERGKHNDLLLRNGEYAAMWRRQAESAGKKGEGDSEVDVGTSSSRPIMSKKVDADVESHGPAAHDAVPLPVAGQQKDVHHVKEEEPVVETPR